jgi:diaminohydroxyphosphoribosylaminopyrimidine deaminase / 5-amino-6-(5-phosphoribosylamino)uracil reductase
MCREPASCSAEWQIWCDSRADGTVRMGEGAGVVRGDLETLCLQVVFLFREEQRVLDYMQRALELASRALGWCSPNPAVGAILVRDGEIVGEGWTQSPGDAHAEIVALRQAGDRAAGATLYVTLEPCSHYGRTPPCTNAIIAAGVVQVVAAMRDPSPWVDGGGFGALDAAGIPTSIGLYEYEARRLNEAYFRWVDTRRPFVTLKYAMTADGKIATRTGSSFWVTGVEARQYVARLRTRVDAVLVGVGTIEADDPQLTARPGELGEPELEPAHQPLRVVMDSTARIDPAARVISGGLPSATIVCTTERAERAKVVELERRGAVVLILPSSDGRVDVRATLDALGQRNITSVLAECGGALGWSLMEAGAVDKVLGFVAPKLVGGVAAPTPLEGEGLPRMDAAWELLDPRWAPLGRDVLLEGYVARISDAPDGHEAELTAARAGD